MTNDDTTIKDAGTIIAWLLRGDAVSARTEFGSAAVEDIDGMISVIDDGGDAIAYIHPEGDPPLLITWRGRRDNDVSPDTIRAFAHAFALAASRVTP
jgi:hypothetical protein